MVLEKDRSGALEDGLDDGDPAFREVARLVAQHLAESVAEHEVEAERRWSFGRRREPLPVAGAGRGRSRRSRLAARNSCLG